LIDYHHEIDDIEGGTVFNPQQVFTDILTNGGASINMAGQPATSGYMVALPEDQEVVVSMDAFRRGGPQIIQQYIQSHPDVSGPGNFFGAWVDGDSVYLDVSENVYDESQAIQLGQQRNQLAIYDIATGNSIDTGRNNKTWDPGSNRK
jgi:hypothetical protein